MSEAQQEKVFLPLSEDDLDFFIAAMVGRKAYFRDYTVAGVFSPEYRQAEKYQRTLEHLKRKLK